MEKFSFSVLKDLLGMRTEELEAMLGEKLMESVRGFLRKAEVRGLLEALWDESLREIRPTFSHAEITYPDAEKVTKTRAGETRSMLKELARIGILIEEPTDTIVACPRCNLSLLALKFCCTSCGSSFLEKGAVIEHLPCGCLDFRRDFEEEGKLVCPKCRRELKALGVDYRTPGFFFRCPSCKNIAAIPKREYSCANCGATFGEDELNLAKVYTYRVDPKAREILGRELERETLDFGPLLRRVEEAGWIVKMPAILKGTTGVEHEVDMALWPPGSVIERDPPATIVEIAISKNDVDETQVAPFFVKKVDLNVDLMLVVVPGMQGRARRLSTIYRALRVLEVPEPREVPGRILDAVLELIEEKRREELPKEKRRRKRK